MSLFIETIKIENGEYRLLGYHNRRLNETVSSFFETVPEIDLRTFLPAVSPTGGYRSGIYKCRVIYGKKIESVDIAPYKKREIKSLKIINGDNIDYSFKKADRALFTDILKRLGKDEDILIVKKGFITDTSFSNVIFFDGRDWITPSSYLLNGVKRRFLLDGKKIKEAQIRANDLGGFEKISLINAMLEPGETSLDISGLFF